MHDHAAYAARVSEPLHLEVPGVDGWTYLPFDKNGDQRVLGVVRGSDGLEIRFSVPTFVEHGDDIASVAIAVIRARERWEELEGLGA
jgi:hypothetical protein